MSKIETDNRLHQLEVAMKSAQVDISNLVKMLEMNRQAIIKLENDRESKELTGGDLCRAMLDRGDKVVLCAVSDDGDFVDGDYDAIRDVDEDGLFESHCSFWWYVQPVNNQGEPLTASEVGL